MVVNSTADGMKDVPRAGPFKGGPGPGDSRATGSVTGPGLGPGNAGFDSPALDGFGCTSTSQAASAAGTSVISSQTRRTIASCGIRPAPGSEL